MYRSKSKRSFKNLKSLRRSISKSEDSKKKNKEISGKFNLRLPGGSDRKLTDRQIDLIYFLTTVIALLGIIYGKEIVLRLFELLISSIF